MDCDGRTQYWIRMEGVSSSRPLTKEELFTEYGERLTADTPCAKVGENQWKKISDLFPDYQNPELQPPAAPLSMEQPSDRYPMLRFLSGLFNILAAIAGVAALITVAFGLSQVGQGQGIPGWFLIFGGIAGGLSGVATNIAIAECIRLFLDIERNTRRKD
jgi:hypothetical protein